MLQEARGHFVQSSLKVTLRGGKVNAKRSWDSGVGVGGGGEGGGWEGREVNQVAILYCYGSLEGINYSSKIHAYKCV